MYSKPFDRFLLKVCVLGWLIILPFISEFIFNIFKFEEMIGAIYTITSILAFIVINRWLSLIPCYNDNALLFIIIAILVSLATPWIIFPLDFKSSPTNFKPRICDFFEELSLGLDKISNFIFDGGLSNFFWEYSVSDGLDIDENSWFIVTGILHIIICFVVLSIYIPDIKEFYQSQIAIKYNYIISNFCIVFSLLSILTLIIFANNCTTLILFGYCIMVSFPVVISFISEHHKINVIPIIMAILLYIFVFFSPFFICAWTLLFGLGILIFIVKCRNQEPSIGPSVREGFLTPYQKDCWKNGNVIFDDFYNELYVDSDGSTYDVNGLQNNINLTDEGTYFKDDNGKIYIKQYYNY